MRTSLLLTLVAIVAAGCAPSTPPATASGRVWETNAAKSLDLSVRLELSQRFLHTGDSLGVRITVTNISDKPLTITANSGAPVYVKLYRINADKFQDEMRRYPQYATTVMKPWTLAPGESRLFPLQLTVAPDWPISEPLRVVAEVNGRSDVQTGIYVEVMPSATKTVTESAVFVPTSDRKGFSSEVSTAPAYDPSKTIYESKMVKDARMKSPASQPVIIPSEIENEPVAAATTRPADTDESKAVENLIKPN